MKNRSPIALFSPLNVIAHFRQLPPSLLKDKHRSKAYRKAQEASFVAEALAGRRAADGKDYWLRIIDDGVGTPDIKTYSWKESGENPDGMWEHFVEVTEYEEHSDDSLVAFLARTKLNKYRDDPELVILCRVSTYVHIPSHAELKQALVDLKAVNPVLICGRLSQNDTPDATYRLIQIDPDPHVVAQHIDFVLGTELLKMTITGVLILDNAKSPGNFPDEKHYPFEELGFIPNADGSYS